MSPGKIVASKPPSAHHRSDFCDHPDQLACSCVPLVPSSRARAWTRAHSHRAQGRATVRRQVRIPAPKRDGDRRGQGDQGGRRRACHSGWIKGDRSGRCDALPRVHRRPHPPDARTDGRLQSRICRRACAARSRSRRSSRPSTPGARSKPGSPLCGTSARTTCSTSGCGTRSPRGSSRARGCWSACTRWGPSAGIPTGTVCGTTCCPQRHEAEGIASGPGPHSRGGALPGQVWCRRDQVLRLGRRALAGRRGRHAPAHAGRDDRPLRRGPPAAQEGRLPQPRRPGRPRRGARGRQLDRARVVPLAATR